MSTEMLQTVLQQGAGSTATEAYPCDMSQGGSRLKTAAAQSRMFKMAVQQGRRKQGD